MTIVKGLEKFEDMSENEAIEFRFEFQAKVSSIWATLETKVRVPSIDDFDIIENGGCFYGNEDGLIMGNCSSQV